MALSNKNCLMKYFLCLLSLLLATPSFTQEIDNLKLPINYPLAQLGSIGEVKVFGKRNFQPIIIIPGWGFDHRQYESFAKSLANKFYVHVINVPGYAKTAVPPLPGEGRSYGEQTWTNAMVAGVENYIRKKKLKKPIIAGHLLVSTQIAIRLGLKYPDLLRSIIILAGPTALNMTGAPVVTTKQRIEMQDQYYGPKFFKKVNRSDWNSGNYPVWFYSKDSLRAKSLYDVVAENEISVMIQYLEEFNAQNTEEEIASLRTKTIVFIPDFLNVPPNDPAFAMLHPSFSDPWKRISEKNRNISLIEVKDSRSFTILDQPDLMLNEIVKLGLK